MNKLLDRCHSGEVTSHIAGFAPRVIRLLESGVKPVFVFDGKPPKQKSGELQARAEKRQEAAEMEAKGDNNQITPSHTSLPSTL